MIRHLRPVRPLLTLWWSWTSITTLCFTGGLWLVGLLFGLTYGFVLFVTPLFIGIVVGMGQARVLLRVWPSITQWGTATIIGLYVGTVIPYILALLIYRTMGLAGMDPLFVWALLYSLPGIILGVAQSRRFPIHARGRYVWMVGNGLGTLGSSAVIEGIEVVHTWGLVSYFVMTTLAALTFAVITGSVVVWLMRQSRDKNVGNDDYAW